MELFEHYLPYWPVLAASLLFLVLGCWWRFSAARAMELAPKPISWVKHYRAGGFPFRTELLGRPRLRWWALLLVLLFAAAFTVGRLANLGMIYQGKPSLLFPSRYALFLTLCCSVGAGAVYCLLVTLFDSLWVAMPGALLFAASAAQGHNYGCFLAVSLLFLLLWLRAEKPGFPAELLYLCALLPLAPLLGLRPALIWLLPCFPLVHWYKLIFQRREGRLSGAQLLLSLLAAAVLWACLIPLSAVMRQLIQSNFQLRLLFATLQPQRLLRACRSLLTDIRGSFLTVPTPGMSINLMVDAPLFGFGFWGCCSAWVLSRKRRDARGVFALLTLAALLLAWLLTRTYALTLGLVLCTACVLRDSDLGRKRWPVVLLTATGICWYVFVQLAAWYVPLTAGIVERLS